jgi:hypothetical protein
MGFIILQGPHHSAEKSTNTGFSPAINSEKGISFAGSIVNFSV